MGIPVPNHPSWKQRAEHTEVTTIVKVKVSKFRNGYNEFRLQKPVAKLYSRLWSMPMTQRLLIVFTASYICMYLNVDLKP
nr:unnamed protein product [Callosobruchus analis]